EPDPQSFQSKRQGRSLPANGRRHQSTLRKFSRASLKRETQNGTNEHIYKKEQTPVPRKKLRILGIIVLLLVVAVVAFIAYRLFVHKGPKPGTVLDEARQANRPAKDFVAADEDYFHDMDGAVPLTPGEVKGRNTWVVWTGGNDHFWDTIGTRSFGALDLLKTLSSYPNDIDPKQHPGEKFKFKRDNRSYYLGLVNEPCFEQPTGPDP